MSDIDDLDVTSDTYMSPFRRAREKSLGLALKKGNYSLRNELDKEYYQNYKVQKLSAKVAADRNIAEKKSKKESLRPLSMRTLALKNNPIYGNNPNSVAYINSLSAHGPSRFKSNSFPNYGSAFAFNPIQQMSRMRDVSLKDPSRNSNMLRDQRLKMLEDEEFLRMNGRLGKFIYSKNRESVPMDRMNPIGPANNFMNPRFNPYSNMGGNDYMNRRINSYQNENFFSKPTKTNFFKFEKPEEMDMEKESETESKQNSNVESENNSEEEYYYDYEDEPETQIKVVNKLPNFQEKVSTTTIESIVQTTTTAPNLEIFQQTDDSTQRLVDLIKDDLIQDEKIEQKKTRKPSVRKLSANKNNGTKLVDWDEIQEDDEEYEKTINLQNALKSFLNSKYENF